ncbi:MAG TPA: hydrogenase maturation protease [Thermoanaerobaculia bacterium]|nr:hydrogenase maturation protease [Thermoanaerobaculia bacterium]
MGKPTPLLILGLGNLLLEDDGLGVAAVRSLVDRYEIPEGVRVLDGGTLGLSLLPHLEDAERAILVDAIRDDAAPGSLVRLEGADVAPAVAARLSVHQIGVVDLLDGARWLGRTPETLVLHGLVPESLELSIDRSACVERNLPELVRRVAEEAAALGFPLRPRCADETPSETSSPVGSRALGL